MKVCWRFCIVNATTPSCSTDLFSITPSLVLFIDADEKSFLIGVELGLRTYPFEGRHAFSWRDVEASDPEDRFEFVADTGTSKVARDFVEHTVLQAVYERKFMKSSSGVSDKELKAVAYA